MMKDTENKKHKNMMSCAKHLIKSYGCMCLFRGINYMIIPYNN